MTLVIIELMPPGASILNGNIVIWNVNNTVHNTKLSEQAVHPFRRQVTLGTEETRGQQGNAGAGLYLAHIHLSTP